MQKSVPIYHVVTPKPIIEAYLSGIAHNFVRADKEALVNLCVYGRDHRCQRPLPYPTAAVILARAMKIVAWS